MKRKSYPQCEKMSAVNAEAQSIGNFLEWLSEQGLFVAEYTKIEGYRDEQAWPINESVEQLLARYFEIDLKKVEKERHAMLAAFQAAA